jgi:hypothetical protein
MRKFKDLDEIEEWLAPMDYQGFWYALEPYELVLQERAHCDGQIKSGEVEETLVLSVLKSMARMEIGERQSLHWRAPTPWVQEVTNI